MVCFTSVCFLPPFSVCLPARSLGIDTAYESEIVGKFRFDKTVDEHGIDQRLHVNPKALFHDDLIVIPCVVSAFYFGLIFKKLFEDYIDLTHHIGGIERSGSIDRSVSHHDNSVRGSDCDTTEIRSQAFDTVRFHIVCPKRNIWSR